MEWLLVKFMLMCWGDGCKDNIRTTYGRKRNEVFDLRWRDSC